MGTPQGHQQAAVVGFLGAGHPGLLRVAGLAHGQHQVRRPADARGRSLHEDASVGVGDQGGLQLLVLPGQGGQVGPHLRGLAAVEQAAERGARGHRGQAVEQAVLVVGDEQHPQGGLGPVGGQVLLLGLLHHRVQHEQAVARDKAEQEQRGHHHHHGGGLEGGALG